MSRGGFQVAAILGGSEYERTTPGAGCGEGFGLSSTWDATLRRRMTPGPGCGASSPREATLDLSSHVCQESLTDITTRTASRTQPMSAGGVSAANA
mmetsp:Transcript_910/g.1477  ORF Transcript_910/g.1477 Transcript_910/m.1477 type:complete len:96 (+) Transcript_910:1106-1393(+)